MQFYIFRVERFNNPLDGRAFLSVINLLCQPAVYVTIRFIIEGKEHRNEKTSL